MVFQKLTDEQKQKLFELKETQSKEYIASLRALIMRGASMEEAAKVVVERDAVKKAYLEAIEQEIEAKREKPKEEAKTETSPKPKRGRKAKKTEEEITNYATSETQIALVEEPAPTKPKRGKKAAASQPPPEETPPEETPAQEVKPKRGRKPKDFNVELTI